MSFQRRATPTFSSLLHAMTRVCRPALRRGVGQTDADRYVKRYGSTDFALALVSHYLIGTDSLRQLKERLDHSPRLRRHVQLHGISHAQLPRLLKERPSDLWEPLVRELMTRVGRRMGHSELRLVDTSFFAMSAKLFSRIHGREFKPEAAGMKLGMVIDPANGTPTQWDLRVGQGNDIEHVETLIPPQIDIEGLTYIFDAGFLKFAFYADLIERGARFITRAQERVKYQTVSARRLDPKHPQIIADDTVLLGSKHSRNRLKQPVRRIEFTTRNQSLTLFTSDLDLPAHQVGDLYRGRWQIEITFRWLKRTIGCLKPLAYSQNAAEHTIYAAIVAYLLILLVTEMTISKHTTKPTPTIKRTLNWIRALLFERPTKQALKALRFT